MAYYEDDWFWTRQYNQNPHARMVQQHLATKAKESTGSSYGHANPENRELVTKETMEENVKLWIQKSLDDNIVVVEPHVMIKFYQMMALIHDKEVYAELVIEPEDGFLVVKDAIIPYQVVTGAHFWSHEDQQAKWLFEMAKNPDGTTRSAEEISNTISSSRPN